jgi:SRSO17 transposase
LPYALGISAHLTVFTTRPRVQRPSANRLGRPRTRLRMLNTLRPAAVRQVVADLPPTAWRQVTWRNGRQPRRTARFAAVRVTPAHEWRHARVAPEVWLLCEEERGHDDATQVLLRRASETASLGALVRLAHQRWAIEQQYQELKSELGLDHFEGRSYPGWHHHVVLTAVAHAYIQHERMRRGSAGLTFPAVCAIVQEIFTALLFAAKPRNMHWMEEAKRNLQLRI